MWAWLCWYLKNVLIAHDQLWNARTGGWPDETFSSRCWRWDRDGVRSWPRKLIDWGARVIFRDLDHCRRSFLSERYGLQLPPEARPRPRRKKRPAADQQ